jgi:hypothetical protein
MRLPKLEETLAVIDMIPVVAIPVSLFHIFARCVFRFDEYYTSYGRYLKTRTGFVDHTIRALPFIGLVIGISEIIKKIFSYDQLCKNPQYFIDSIRSLASMNLGIGIRLAAMERFKKIIPIRMWKENLDYLKKELYKINFRDINHYIEYLQFLEEDTLNEFPSPKLSLKELSYTDGIFVSRQEQFSFISQLSSQQLLVLLPRFKNLNDEDKIQILGRLNLSSSGIEGNLINEFLANNLYHLLLEADDERLKAALVANPQVLTTLLHPERLYHVWGNPSIRSQPPLDEDHFYIKERPESRALKALKKRCLNTAFLDEVALRNPQINEFRDRDAEDARAQEIEQERLALEAARQAAVNVPPIPREIEELTEE